MTNQDTDYCLACYEHAITKAEPYFPYAALAKKQTKTKQNKTKQLGYREWYIAALHKTVLPYNVHGLRTRRLATQHLPSECHIKRYLTPQEHTQVVLILTL